MAYKTLLLVLDDRPGEESRTAMAIDLAKRFDAHLVGLALVAEPVYPSMVTVELPVGLLESRQQDLEARADKMLAGFAAATEAAGLSSVEQRKLVNQYEDVAGAAAMQARHADLTIIGQADVEKDDALVVEIPERVVLDSGRPVMVVPYAGRFEGLGKRALVAWNASREAARALAASLPLLQTMDEVEVVSINPRRGTHAHGDMPGVDIATVLARHGVRAEVEVLQGDSGSAGETLLSRAADRSSDLIVMGAYGHSRLREMVLGGATRQMFSSMTVPTVMCH